VNDLPGRPPEFVLGSALLEGSYTMAWQLHDGPRSEAEKDLGHPLAVALLMEGAGFDEELVAAAMLHEVIEETDTEAADIGERFGPEVADLVAAMTEDETISSYRIRKREHRDRVSTDPCVAAIYVADKLATTRQMNEEGEEPEAQRLEHFRATLRELSDAHPELPFLGELRTELDRLG
jgi:(p)ppGpp synthase/HD superfamily hydrolase